MFTKLFTALLLSTFSVLGASGLDNAIRIQDGSSSTNTRSSLVTVVAQTNVYAGTVTATNALTAGTTLAVGTTATVGTSVTVGSAGTIGSVTLADTDGDHTWRLVPTGTTTTDINMIGPAAPFSGIMTLLISSTTNATIGAMVVGTNLTYDAATRTLASTASGSGGGGGNMVNTGASVAGGVPTYSDTTGTNIVPTASIVVTTTNVAMKGVASVNGLYATNTANIPSLYGSDGTTRLNVPYTAYSAGTAYALTATAAALDFGTTDPVATIAAPGTYRVSGTVNLRYNGATFAANRTVTIKLRRTNNTAADLTNGSDTYTTAIITTITGAFVVAKLDVIYTTANNNDTVTLFGDVSVVPTAGSLDATSANIVAVRLYE